MTDIVERLNEACVGHPHAKIAWPHRLLHDARDEIEKLREALKPFAHMKMARPEQPDVIAWLGIRGEPSIMNGDIMRARAALDSHKRHTSGGQNG